MDLHLKEKVVIVTGAAKGIGRAVTETLVEEGAIPVIVGRSEEEAKILAAEIKEKGGNCLVINANLGADYDCKIIIDKVVAEFGKIDGLVNNAGTNDGVGLLEGDPKRFLASVTKNLTHYYDLFHYAAKYLIESKGSVVNISSKTALTGQGGTSGYAASKGAQLALTREWAVEMLPHGVRVNAIVPSEVITPQYENWVKKFPNPEETLKTITDKIPLGKRFTTPEEIASMTVFLLSNKSAHTTGQWLFVDGGYVHLDRALT